MSPVIMNIRGRPLASLHRVTASDISDHCPGQNYLLLDSRINISLETVREQNRSKRHSKEVNRELYYEN